MSSLVVGGVVIPVAFSSPTWSETDAVDRSRTFDNSFFASQAGGTAREWSFSTPPVTQANADIYRAVLRSPAAKLCYGDILSIPTMCSPELLNGKPTRGAAPGSLVVLDFMLHEVQAANVLLRYAPGDTITGESFSRASGATYIASNGQVQTVTSNVKRDGHYASINGTRGLLVEGARTNGWTKAEQLDDAAWSKTGLTVTANATTAPDGATTADKLVESALNEARALFRTFTGATNNTLQSASYHVKAAERTWLRIATVDKSNTVRQSWVNLSTGTVGTVNAGHTLRITPLVDSWYRVAITFSSATGATTPQVDIAPALADSGGAYAGNGTSGIYAWGGMIEVDAPFASSYIATTTATVTRAADSYSIPSTTPPQELTALIEVIEYGTSLTGAARLFEFANAADADPRFLVYNPSIGSYRAYHGEGGSSVISTLAAGPVIGDRVEIVARLFGDGSVDILQSLNGAAATSATQSAALGLGSAFSGNLLWLNSAGTAAGTEGFAVIQSVKIVAGARSLADMRAA